MLVASGLLLVAIAVEVAATSMLPRSDGFRDPFWTAFVLVGYAFSIWLLAIVVRDIPVSTTYAVWSGLGTAAVAVIGLVWLGESWDWVTVLALSMVVVGVVLLNLRLAH